MSNNLYHIKELTYKYFSVYLAVLGAEIVREVFLCFDDALVILSKCHEDGTKMKNMPDLHFIW